MRVAIVAMGPTNRVWFDKVYNKATRTDYYQKAFDSLVETVHNNELPVDDECLNMVVQLSKKIGDTADIEEEYDQVWVINGMSCVLRKYDKVFHMDDLKTTRTLPDDLSVPVVSSALNDDFNVELFPIQEVVEEFGSLYLNNTVVYAFVYALLQKVEHIGLFGCDFNPHNGMDVMTADAAAACMEYWIREAEHRNITVEIPKGCRLMGMDGDKRLYGYEEQPDIRIGDSKMIFNKGWKIEHSPIVRNNKPDQGPETPEVHVEDVQSPETTK